MQHSFHIRRSQTQIGRRRISSRVPELFFSSKENDSEGLDISLANAIRPHFETQSPVVLRGAVSKAPAIELWKSLDYWRKTVGHEVAKVEIGGSYANTDGESATAEIPVEGYLQYLEAFEERHGKQQSSRNETGPKQVEIVYMAQNDLFPSLYNDISIPAFCQDEKQSCGLGRLYSVMLWLGPYGSVSPLHNDPLDNYFMQIVGRKSIILFPPHTQTYAGTNGQQSNTSPIEFDKGKEEYKKYPLFDPEVGMSCIINPGDALYIPSKWWHHVQSLETSASINVWWR